MIQVGWNEIVRALGLTMEGKDLNLWQMALRAILIFIIGLITVRVGDKRFLGRSSAFDALLAVVLGSVLSRAINGSAPFVPTIGAGFVLVGLHWLFSVLAFHSHRFGLLVKGSKRLLIKDGQLQWDAMRRSHVTDHDLGESLRMRAKLDELDQVKSAYLERSGDISVIPRTGPPEAIDVEAEAGVQTVRIESGPPEQGLATWR